MLIFLFCFVFFIDLVYGYHLAFSRDEGVGRGESQELKSSVLCGKINLPSLVCFNKFL